MRDVFAGIGYALAFSTIMYCLVHVGRATPLASVLIGAVGLVAVLILACCDTVRNDE
jgi:hypothetical protein